jgi:hypothetical protein
MEIRAYPPPRARQPVWASPDSQIRFHTQLARLLADERQQGEMAGTFDGRRQKALMPGTGTGLAAWTNLATFADETAELIGLFVIDRLTLVRTELAHFRPWDVSSPAPFAAWSRRSV